MLQLCDVNVINKLFNSVIILVVMIKKWLTAVSCMQTTQVHCRAHPHAPSLESTDQVNMTQQQDKASVSQVKPDL